MKKYILSIFAVVLAVGMVAFTAPSQSTVKQDLGVLNYYFQFTGTHGDESEPGEWQEISKTAYDNLACMGGSKGCRITTISVDNPSDPLGDRVISSVTVDNNDVPQVTSENTEVANKP